MSRARAALELAAEHGVSVRVDGEELRLAAAAPPPEVVLSALREAKAEVLRVLEEAANDARPIAAASDLAALAADTARRAHAAVSEPADAEDAAEAAAEREAIQHQDGPAPPDGLTPEYLAGIEVAARATVPDDWPELALLGADAYEACRANPDGSIETCRRMPDGTWSPPALTRAAHFEKAKKRGNGR